MELLWVILDPFDHALRLNEKTIRKLLATFHVVIIECLADISLDERVQ